MKIKIDLSRVRETIPKNIIWGRRSPGEENQLAQFLRWVAWVCDVSVGDVAREIDYTNNSFHVNTRSGGSSAKFKQAVFIMVQNLFAGCPIDMRQIIEIGDLTGEDPDRWSSIVDQIRNFVEQEA